jgi:hypothetical protein
MAEYCKQCFDDLFPADTANTLTTSRRALITCEGCGETIVDNKGRCTGACGKDKHSSIFMTYIFETRPPGFTFANINQKTFKGRLFKLTVDIIQWLPRTAFVLGLFYMFGTAIFLRILEIKKSPEELEKAAELACARASRLYESSLNFWYAVEMKLENILFG